MKMRQGWGQRIIINHVSFVYRTQQQPWILIICSGYIFPLDTEQKSKHQHFLLLFLFSSKFSYNPGLEDTWNPLLSWSPVFEGVLCWSPTQFKLRKKNCQKGEQDGALRLPIQSERLGSRLIRHTSHQITVTKVRYTAFLFELWSLLLHFHLDICIYRFLIQILCLGVFLACVRAILILISPPPLHFHFIFTFFLLLQYGRRTWLFSGKIGHWKSDRKARLSQENLYSSS